MIFRQKPPVLLPLDGRLPQNVSEWLEVATWNLVPSAQARIRAEIESHYAQALQSYRANESSDVAANTTALADLGDARAAARRFSRQYLTIGEARLVGRRIKAARSTGPLSYLPWMILLGSILVILALIGCWALAPAAGGRFLLCAVASLTLALIYASACIAARKLARQKSTLATVRRLILLERVKLLSMYLLNLANMVAVLMNNSTDIFQDQPYAFLTALDTYEDLAVKIGCGMSVFGILVAAVATNLADSRLRKKLASASEDDLPPPDPSTA
jgi:hypothetical protein